MDDGILPIIIEVHAVYALAAAILLLRRSFPPFVVRSCTHYSPTNLGVSPFIAFIDFSLFQREQPSKAGADEFAYLPIYLFNNITYYYKSNIRIIRVSR